MANCKNPSCQKHFKQYNSLHRYCSSACQVAHKGKPKKIKQVSNKRKENNEKYSIMRKQFLEKFPICPITNKPTTDIHHKKGRKGYADDWARENNISLFLDVRFWVALSREGHCFVEDNPIWAKENGYSLNRI